MARSTVTHTCGHTSHVTGHNRKDADRRAAWAGRNACWECEKQAATEAARKGAEASGLPALTGSEKQVAYAESLRVTKLGFFAVTLAEFRGLAAGIPDAAVRQEALDALILLEDEIKQNASAKFWIEVYANNWDGWIFGQISDRGLCPSVTWSR